LRLLQVSVLSSTAFTGHKLISYEHAGKFK
jgi:hypothetical protein